MLVISYTSKGRLRPCLAAFGRAAFLTSSGLMMCNTTGSRVAVRLPPSRVQLLPRRYKKRCGDASDGSVALPVKDTTWARGQSLHMSVETR